MGTGALQIMFEHVQKSPPEPVPSTPTFRPKQPPMEWVIKTLLFALAAFCKLNIQYIRAHHYNLYLRFLQLDLYNGVPR